MNLPSPHTDPRGFLRALFDAAVAQAVPGAEMAEFLPGPPKGRTLVLGAGKAGGSMAAAVDSLWPRNAPISGLVVTRYDYVPAAYKTSPGRIEVVEAAHPVPDEAGRRAAQLMQVCAANGMGNLDHSALVKSLELMANHPVAPDPKG